MTTIKDKLKQKALALPLLPGVYLMKDKEESIIYVGKSKHLKKRVSSYFGNSTGRPRKVERMVKQIADFDYQITDTELDALLLECDLIKQIKPLYNRLLKNDSRYRYIHLNEKKEIPFWESAYDKSGSGIYFGPYDMKNELQLGIDAVNKYYSLASCKGKPNTACCLALLRKECLAPCLADMASHCYDQRLSESAKFFKNENNDILLFYEKQMNEAAERLDFEEAQKYKEIWGVLNRLTYREKAIAWSLSGTKTIAFIPKPAGGIKVYFFVGTTIIKTISIKKKRLLKQWLSYFDQEIPNISHVDKSQMDRAYIIYNYLHRNEECETINV